MEEKYYEVHYEVHYVSGKGSFVRVLYSGTDLGKAVDIFIANSNDVFKYEKVMEELKEKPLVTYCFETRERRTAVTIVKF